jgi:hypothetical protein
MIEILPGKSSDDLPAVEGCDLFVCRTLPISENSQFCEVAAKAGG